MDKVFVVLANMGEYSDRQIWVGAVFTEESEAEKFIETRSAIKRVYDIWDKQAHDELQKISHSSGVPIVDVPYSEMKEGEWAAAKALAEERAGPKPEFEEAEYYEIYECPINTLIRRVDPVEEAIAANLEEQEAERRQVQTSTT